MADAKGKGPVGLSREDMMEAFSEGVRRGIWDIVTSATKMPGHDFYAAIEDGAARGMEEAAKGGKR